MSEKSFELKIMSTNDAGLSDLERKSFRPRLRAFNNAALKLRRKHGCLSTLHFLKMKGELFSFESDETQ